MPRLYSILLALLCMTAPAFARESVSGDYYIDLVNFNDTKYYFTQGTDGLYTVTVPKLTGDFKIYASGYDPQQPDNNMSYGAPDHGSAGISMGQTKDLAHPGRNLALENGGTYYDAFIEFDPIKMTVRLVSGSTTPVEPPTTLPPLLVGQFLGPDGQDVNWDPNIVIKPVLDDETGYYVFEEVRFVLDGEFSFTTIQSPSWDEVNKGERYAPSQSVMGIYPSYWIPYETFRGSTSNKWELTGPWRGYVSKEYKYTVLFDPAKKQIMIDYAFITGIEDTAVGNNENNPVDVISLSGMVVRRDVDRANATAGLPAGLYVVGGHKVLVR